MNNGYLYKLKTEIDKYKYISFDIFDTLVKRDCYKPTELFHLMEKEIDDEFGIMSSFAYRRVQAEKDTKKKSAADEITLDEIYANVDLGLSRIDMVQIKQREQKLECEFCQWNPFMKPVYEYCRFHDKKILIITDMYLPKNCIESILAKLGIKYESLFISSEIKKRKSRGGLFRYALNNLGVNPSEVLHIGDNKKSDFLMPKLLGMHSIHIPTEEKLNLFINKDAYKTNPEYADLCAFINTHSATHEWNAVNLENPSDYFSQAGYEAEGPVLYGFVRWLEQQFQKDGIEKVFFLARDGQIMRKAFEKLGNQIPQEYMYVSRRALIVPTLWMDADLDHLDRNMFLPLYITIKSLLNKMGIKYKPYEEYFVGAGLDCLKSYNCRDLLKNEKFIQIYNQHVKQTVINHSKEQYNLLVNYLVQLRLHGKIAIVDIGWFGHMQFALEKIVQAAQIPAEIYGYYLGLTPISPLLGSMKASGYLFDKNKNEADAEKEATFNAIVEALFTADHGTTLEYRIENGKTIPVLDTWEYEASELREDYEWIRSAQAGALSFIDDALNTKSGKILLKDMDFRVTFLNWLQMGCYPSSRCAKYFGNLHFLDDGVQPFAIQGKGIKYLACPKKFAYDFIKSVWRVGFLTRTFGTWPPKYSMYKQIRRFAHKIAK